jgi:ParB-like chromosome segregation protein Spo0J
VKTVALRPDQIVISPELERTRKDKQFEERLRASIEQIGLVEPLKVAALGERRYLIVDGMLRWRAIEAIRSEDDSQFRTVPAYVVSHDKRYEIRYQTDIYQDLLPSQLAALVEHLHQNDHIRKTQIAAYIGVSAPTLRNYTGLWRLIQRGGLFARIVDLMDAGVLPASNPYAWLRLTDKGIRMAIDRHLAEEESAEEWVEAAMEQAAAGQLRPLPLKTVETITGYLPADCYREDEEVRSQKRELGLRRAKQMSLDVDADSTTAALRHLRSVARRADSDVLKIAAKSLQAALT